MKSAPLLFAGTALFVAAQLATVCAQTETVDLRALAKKARPSVLLLVVSDATGTEIATGTGFLISSDGKLITNHHVVENAASGLAKAENGGLFPIEGILADDPTNDLVLLKLAAKDLPFLFLNEKAKVEVGNRVAVIGSPLGLEGTLSEGIVSALRDFTGEIRMFQMTAAISPGSSGSPVLNTKGEVIGIASSQLRGGQLLNLAVPVECATRLIAKVQPSTKPSPLRQPAGNLVTKKDYFSSIAAVPVMKGLQKIRVMIAAPSGGELLTFQLRTDIEIKLRRAGLIIDENADALFQVAIAMTDIDPTGLRILGKYGSAGTILYDMVKLKRASAVEVPAPIWRSMERLFHGPPDTIVAQARQIADDSTDEFVNEFLKQNQ